MIKLGAGLAQNFSQYRFHCQLQVFLLYCISMEIIQGGKKKKRALPEINSVTFYLILATLMFKMILIKPQSYASTVSLKFRVLDLILSSPLVVGPALIPTASHLVEDIFLFSFSSSMEFQSGVCCPFPKDKGFCFLGELKRQILANFVSLRYPLLFSTSKHAL